MGIARRYNLSRNEIEITAGSRTGISPETTQRWHGQVPHLLKTLPAPPRLPHRIACHAGPVRTATEQHNPIKAAHRHLVAFQEQHGPPILSQAAASPHLRQKPHHNGVLASHAIEIQRERAEAEAVLQQGGLQPPVQFGEVCGDVEDGGWPVGEDEEAAGQWVV